MIFPPEIWQIILNYSEALVLINARPVCTLWKNIIDKILEERDHWYRQCVEDVPRQFWYIFYEKLDPEAEIDKIAINDSKKWMTMYKSWVTCKNVKSCSIDTGEFEPLPKHPAKQDISCMEVLNNLMAVGTSDGFVYVYDINRLCDPPILTADHLEFVKSIQFVKNGNHICIVSCSINNHVKFWDIELKKLVKKKRGQLMCTNYYNLCVAMKNVFFVENSSSCTLTELHYASHSIVLVAILYNDMVVIYTQTGWYEKYLLEDPRVMYSSKYLPPPAPNVRQFYAFKPEIIAYISDLGLIGFSVEANGWREYNTHSALNGTPTTILIYGQLLILGLNIGVIHMFYFEDFEMLDFSSKNSKLVILNHMEAVLSMAIFFHEEEQYLAAAQMKKIHVFQFV